MNLKSSLILGALVALGGIALSTTEGRAYTTYCATGHWSYGWSPYGDGPAGGIASSGTGDSIIGDGFIVYPIGQSYPRIITECSDRVALVNPSYQCPLWQAKAQHAMVSGTRNDLRNGQRVDIPVYAGVAFVQPGGWGTPSTGLRYANVGTITCNYGGGGGGGPPNIVSGRSTTVGNGQILSTTTPSFVGPTGGYTNSGTMESGDSVGYRR